MDLTPYIKLMGKEPDGKVAQRAGCAKTTISVHRRALGILPFREPAGGGIGERVDLTPYIPLMGKEPDPAIAQRAGCGVSTVATRRRALGIDGYKPPKEDLAWDGVTTRHPLKRRVVIIRGGEK
jgi:hypothetical protein